MYKDDILKFLKENFWKIFLTIILLTILIFTGLNFVVQGRSNNAKNAKIEMENIKNALVELDKDNADYYESNYQKYAKMLDELDAKYKESLENLPKKEIVVSHEAYGYLCKDYGLTQIGVKGVNAETEPDAKKMAEIISYIKENNITTIFTEELIDPKVSNIIASETGCQVKVLSPIEGLSQEQVDNKADYFSIMEENLENLVGALK